MKVRERRDALLGRIPVLRLGFLVCLTVILSTYWFVQVARGDRYAELAEHNRLRKSPIQAPRGLIYDRNGRLLVENVPSYNLLLDRSRSASIEASLAMASRTLERPVEELAAVLERYPATPRFQPVLIAEKLSLSEVARFGVMGYEHPEFEIMVRHLRLYRHGPQTAHVLGYLGEVSETDLERPDSPYRPGELIGKKGLERVLDLSLRGRDGERVVVVDSRGRLMEEFGGELSRAGEPSRLTLDLELQQAAVRYMEDKVGAVVAMDPDNGEVLAMLSMPSFNANDFARRLERSEWEALVSSEHFPLQNRAIQSTYPLGSVFKIVVALAGLGEGAVDEDDAVYCSGSVKLYKRHVRCWKYGGHGWVNLKKSLKESCDVYFYLLGQKLGISTIAEYARRLGLGSTTGIELAGEQDGLVPDPEWSRRVRGEPWYPGETISVAIGQGPLLVTPLQVASMMAMVANGGYRVFPHLTLDGEVRPRTPVPIDASHMAMIRDALWSVVNDRGTGARARVDGVDVGGKTSTVQVIRQKGWIDSDTLPFKHRDHAWFASYGEAGARKLVVVVFVEHGGKGSQAAAPLAKILYETYFEHHLEQQRAT